MADLLGADFGLAEAHKLYRCHDRLLHYKEELFSHLVNRWRDMFNASFDVLLYDLTSTYVAGGIEPRKSDDDDNGAGGPVVLSEPVGSEGQLFIWNDGRNGRLGQPLFAHDVLQVGLVDSQDLVAQVVDQFEDGQSFLGGPVRRDAERDGER
jgi:hypothetical protein